MCRTILYSTAQRALNHAITDLRTLAGDELGPSDASWQDVAGTVAVNLRCVATYLEQACERGDAHMLEMPP